MIEAHFIEAALRNRFNKKILERLLELNLTDSWLVSGALFQTIWNVVTDRSPTFGIRDYDVFYFDADLSWTAEDAVIGRSRAAFADLPIDVEVRNQARVHLWYPEKFGMPYPPAARATDGINRFLMTCAQIGVRKVGRTYEVYAPNGFDDIERMVVRPNLT